MKLHFVGILAICMGIMALGSVSGVCAATAPAKPSQTADMSTTAARFLRDIRADAANIRSLAANLDRSTTDQNVKWVDYDRQWNEIQPVVEDMHMKLARPENMKGAISAAESKDVEHLVLEIQRTTDAFLYLLDKPGEMTTDAGFKTCARNLMDESGKLEKVAEIG